VTRHGLILFHVEAAPLWRKNECALFVNHGAKGGPTDRPQDMIQPSPDRISDRSGHAERHRASESARAISGKVLKYP
jgi:hypothetical protein